LGYALPVSSIFGGLANGVSVAMRDLYRLVMGKMPSPDRVVWLSRVSLVITISISLGFALLSNDIISYITKMIAILMSGMCVCGLLGRFWPRYNWQGAMASLLASMCTALSISLQPAWSEYWGNPVIPALLSGIIIGWGVTLLTPKSLLNAEQALEKLNAERAEMESL